MYTCDTIFGSTQGPIGLRSQWNLIELECSLKNSNTSKVHSYLNGDFGNRNHSGIIGNLKLVDNENQADFINYNEL